MKRLLLCLAIPLLLTACDEDDGASTGPSLGGSTVDGTLLRQPGTEPVSGIEVYLIDRSDFTVAEGPARTDRHGAFRFRHVEAGEYYVFPLTKSDIVLYQNPAVLRVDGRSTATYEMVVVDSEAFSGEGPIVRGIVVDDDTGGPLAGAYVTHNYSALGPNVAGLHTPYESITSTSGQFVANALVVRDPFDPEGSGALAPLFIMKEGYEPTMIGERERFEVGETIDVGEIRLRKMEGGASLRGKLVSAAGPVKGVRIGLDFAGLPIRKDTDKAPLLGQLAISDDDGEFRFDGLAWGIYQLSPALDTDDGWVKSPFENLTAFMGADVDMGEISLYPAIEMITPRAGDRIETPTPTFEWTPVLGAHRYELSFTSGHVFSNLPVEVTEPSWQWLEGPFQIPAGTTGGLRWRVRAFDEVDDFLGETEIVHGAELAIPE